MPYLYFFYYLILKLKFQHNKLGIQIIKRLQTQQAMKSTKTFNLFRKIAFAEGVSFLVLLLISMPLKYFANLPIGVTIIGGLHGLLFILFIVMAVVVMRKYKKNLVWLVKSFIASVIPLGTFWMDHAEWKKEEVAIGKETE